MHADLDHVFLCVSTGAPEARRLLELGLTEGAPNRHPGQGTQCRRFFFQNAYLELLWVVDFKEAQSEAVRRTGLYERWARREGGSSPIGVCLRPGEQGGIQAPFGAWEYRPPYLLDPLVIQIAKNSECRAEPFAAYLAFARRPDSYEPSRRQPLEHAAGLRAITSLKVGIRQDGPVSPELLAIERHCPQVRFVAANEPLLEIGFDDEAQRRRADLRPALPLIIRW